MARPPQYRKEFAKQAMNFCLLGATDEDLAGFFDVTDRTIRNWKRDYPEFAKAVESGKAPADAAVARSLYNKAIRGDTVACIFWLKNRRQSDWREKIDHEHGGRNGKPIETVTRIELVAMDDSDRAN